MIAAVLAATAYPPLAASPDPTAAGGQAGTIRVRCERRGSQRSRISVDGTNLAAGRYHARVTSGANSEVSTSKAAVSGEVEFDFDSNPRDVAAGAVRISPTFIQAGRVKGEIRSASGAVVVAATVACEMR
jgi:hypothetical protein